MNSLDIRERVFKDMSEGVMVLDSNGKIIMTNPRIAEVLEKDVDKMIGKQFAALFFDDEKNDDFTQTILDAIYEKEVVHSNLVKYYSGNELKYLKVITSGLMGDDSTAIGVIVVVSDMTELVEVKVKNTFIRTVLGKYLSDDVANAVLNDPKGVEVGGKKEYITILMSDLRGFTAMCEEIDPDKLMKLTNHYFGKMGKIIKENGGTIIEYMGDGILSIFGAPLPMDNHAEAAVLSAIKMQLGMEEINAWNREEGLPELNMGIGINSGVAVVGNMGSEYTMKYNVIGSAVNMCGRVESYSTGGQILITGETLNNVHCDLTIENTIDIRPKGAKESMEIYSVSKMGAPYNIGCKIDQAEFVQYDEPVKADLYLLDGKHVSDMKIEIHICGESENGYIINSESELELYQNALIKTQGMEVYCKFVKKKEDIYEVIKCS